jgi:hypothetical protein
LRGLACDTIGERRPRAARRIEKPAPFQQREHDVLLDIFTVGIAEPHGARDPTCMIGSRPHHGAQCALIHEMVGLRGRVGDIRRAPSHRLRGGQ